MKRFLTICAVVAVQATYAGPPPKPAIIIYDPIPDAPAVITIIINTITQALFGTMVL